MLISRKVIKDKRAITDLRHLKVRIAKNNVAYPLLKDTFSVLDSSRCEVLSVSDLKDAFPSLRLSEIMKKNIIGSCNILVALHTCIRECLCNISPSIWQSYINAILDCLQSRKYCKATMDNLLLFTSTKKSHIAKLEYLFIRNSPKKCQLFRKELQYIGNTILIKDKGVCIKPLRSRWEAIQKLKTPTAVKGCRRFAGMVNFLSISCLELQKWSKPVYNLIRKGRQFIWGAEQQLAFEEIKCTLIKPPVLHLPDNKGRFHSYSHSCKFTTGSALYQIQNGKPKLIAYASKGLPEAARNYSIAELEMYGVAINIASFAHLLKKSRFWCYSRSFSFKAFN